MRHECSGRQMQEVPLFELLKSLKFVEYLLLRLRCTSGGGVRSMAALQQRDPLA